jgi:peroxidase
LYESPDDVELTVGASLERHVEKTLVGPTFLNIMAEQFLRTRTGDRFWFESGNPDVAFTIGGWSASRGPGRSDSPLLLNF